ncbi:2OG-Fe(II) oxygenase [bacterium]|nr:2OG-Fe(II) oxygenase [bacterium]
MELITVDTELANAVEKELYSIRPNWQYMSITTSYYEDFASEETRRDLDLINEKYGPVIDTQRFTYDIFSKNVIQQQNLKGFIDIRANPNSRYNKLFPSMAKLVDHLQFTYIPKGYVVHRLMTNMQTIRPQWSMNAPHPDFHNKEYITILYYVNDSDGDTYFFEGSECVAKIAPIKGTAAMYPSCMFHAGSTPTKTETRVVINMCFGPPINLRKGARAV